MTRSEESSLLSAAECAARTGLSTRALRLYEEQGLISPRRSAGGWRQYGAAELPRLNSVVLLKAAGLTPAQIATVISGDESEPILLRFADGLMKGQPNYDEMRPALAYAARWQLPSISANLTRLGAIRSIAFQGVGSVGWDVNDVEHEHGHSRFRICFERTDS